MAEFKLGRIRFVWKGNWNTGSEYYKDDVVQLGGKVYICVEGHIASPDFFTDLNNIPTKWNLISDGQRWQGDWLNSFSYLNSDIVKYGGRLYICNNSHTSFTDSGTDEYVITVQQGENVANGIFYSDGYESPDLQMLRGVTYIWNQDDPSNLFEGAGIPVHPMVMSATQDGTHNGGTIYEEGAQYFLDGVEVADALAYAEGFAEATTRQFRFTPNQNTPDTMYYFCYYHPNMSGDASIEVVSIGLEADSSNWDVFADGIDYKGKWERDFVYRVNDLVNYGGISYVCISEHQSAETFDRGLEVDFGSWEVFNAGFEYKNDWTMHFRYKKNDIVKYGAGLWIATEGFESAHLFEDDIAKWDKFVEGIQFENEWDAYKLYETGDIVSYGGNQYIAVSDNTEQFPSTSNEWNLFSQGLKFVGDWNEDSSNIEYREGEVVRLGGFTYRCVKDHSNQQPPNEEFWQRLNSGFEWRFEWLDGAEYYAGDVVRFGDNSYVANSYHIADDGINSPDIADSSEFWSIIAVGTEQSVLTTTGDLVYYAGDAPVRLPIGQDGQILQVSSDLVPEWVFLDFQQDVYYVAEHGEDEPAPIYGKSVDRPWRSIRYATHQIEKGARNPDAKQLLELNRRFIQREVLEWTEEQIANSVAPFDGAFDFDTEKYNRDIGRLVDAVVWDVSHGGNVRSREEAIEYINDIERDYINGQESETSAMINRSLTVIEAVLAQVDPDIVYQIERGDNSTRIVEQYKNSSLEAEEGVFNEIATLVGIVSTAVTDDDVDNIPAKVERHTLVKVSTGRYYEVLPIIVPRLCCVMGDELRSTRVEARKSTNATLTPVDDFKYSFQGLSRIEQIIGDIVEGATVSATTGNSLIQSQDWPFAETAVVAPQTEKLFRSIRRQIDEKVSLKREAEFAPAYNLSTPELGKSRDLVRKNIEFIKAEGIAFLLDAITEPRDTRFSKTAFKNELEDVIDAISYDMTYGGNWQSVTVGEAIVEIGTLQSTTDETNLLISVYNYLNDVVKDVATSTEIVSPFQTDVEQILGAGGTTTSTNKIDNLFTNIIDTITSGEGTVAITFPTVTDTDATTVINAINSAKSQIEDDAIAFINLNFPDLEYDTAKCERDVGYILDAAKYDLGLDTNFASVVAAYSYLRQTGEKVLAEQKEASLANFEFLRQRTLQEVPAGAEYDFARTSINETYEWLDDIVFGGASEGNNYQTEDQEVFNAVRQLELNKEFIVEETMAYVNEYFKDTVTDIDTTENTLTISSTDWLHLYMPIQFTDDSTDVVDSGLSDTATYFVRDIVSATEFTISDTVGGSELDLTQAWPGEFTVQKAYAYSQVLCARDVREYIDAVKWDLVWPAQWERTYTGTAGVADFEIYRPASYKHRLAARYYANSVLGSQEEDMYHLRNGTGLRLHTVAGLQGDLGAANEFGTRRPTAGAYASLDPGWGPADERVWITERSPYVQNLTTFGFAAVGQKIDGELHDGGNDSIVSNDFTQVISDGIGAWITNNGRAELVSVFSYYAHVGYLAERGGRIRATNGNNSYGTFGSVAEGVDPEETPVTAVVDNRTQFNATMNNVYTDGDKLLSVEFGHAGNNYTEAKIEFFGPGENEEIQEDEFRDDGVFQVRINEAQEGEAGGNGFVIESNTAQQGTLTSIFLAATDGRASSAYPGMKIYLIGGAGRGQYGIIDTYLAGSKEATVVKENGTPGWEHIVAGSEIVAPNSTTTYQIEPRIEFTAPPVTNTAVTVPSATYEAIEYAETTAVYTAVSASGGTGSGAVFDVTRNGSKYFVSLNSGGTGYTRLDELTLSGTDLGGASTSNDITVIVLSLDNNGVITEFEFSGIGQKGVFVAVPTSGSSAYKSVDGNTWDTVTLASNDTWNDIASGLLDDGSSIFKPDSIVIVSQDGTVNYSTDGADTWTSVLTGLPTSGTKRIAFGNVGVDNNRFVVTSDNSQDVAFSIDGGENWTVTTGALPGTGYDVLAHGKGLFVALASNTANVVHSSDGVTWSAGNNLPNKDWQDLAWGNGRFVALAADGSVSYSLNGIAWSDAVTTEVASGRRIAYGQGVFAATGTTQEIQYSEDGIEWQAQSGLATDYSAIAFGNPARTGRFVAISDGATTAGVDFRAGATARGRAGVSNQQIFEIRLLEPGSGYASEPTITVTDPNNTDDVLLDPRLGKGALGNPTYISRGIGFTEATAEINDLESNGEANFLQSTDQIAVKRLSTRPVDGSNVVFDSIPGKFFKLVNTVSFTGNADGSFTAFLRISPALTINEAPQDEDPVTLRIRYSQVRLTGHDFLDIGTGNFEETNYPNEPEYQPEQENETVDSDGGRVFFTSTDQDGNFRVGDLFSVEQSTGVASINADAFNLAGLQELTLGEVTLGGNSASINEFSTDPFFTANSDNIVPTQRAVKSFIESQIGGGGASLNVNSVTAGDIFVGGNQITAVSGDPINITANVVFRGAVLGVPFAYQYFLR